VARAQEEAGTIRPARGSQRICKVFTEQGHPVSAQRIAQYGSIPQTGNHCGQLGALMARRAATSSCRPRN